MPLHTNRSEATNYGLAYKLPVYGFSYLQIFLYSQLGCFGLVPLPPVASSLLLPDSIPVSYHRGLLLSLPFSQDYFLPSHDLSLLM